MKPQTILIALSAAVAVQGFAPAKLEGRPATDLKKSIFDTVSDMDLFNTDGVGSGLNRNAYGARNNKLYQKNLKTGRITKNSYVPAGMTREQYSKLRDNETKNKDAAYQRNVNKGGVFQVFTDWYTTRGTDNVDNWRSATNGHTLAKTKYDWDNVKSLGTTANQGVDGNGKKQFKKYTPAVKKTTAKQFKVTASGKKQPVKKAGGLKNIFEKKYGKL